MTFTVVDFPDLITLIDKHPEWRSRLREALFPEIDIPRAFQQLADAQRETSETLKRLEAFIERQFPNLEGKITKLETDVSELKTDVSLLKTDVSELKTDVSLLKTDVAELKTDVSLLKTDVAELKTDVSLLKTDVAELKTDVSLLKTDVAELKTDVSLLKTDVAELKTDVAELKTDVSLLKTDVAELRTDVHHLQGSNRTILRDMALVKGESYEGAIRDKATGIFGSILRRGREAMNDAADLLYDAVDAGKVIEQDLRHVLALDLLWSGKLRPTNAEAMLAIEVSWFAEINDIERAIQRATILQKSGLTALPTVAGKEWASTAQEMALARGVIMVKDRFVDQESWQTAQTLWL